MIVAASVGVTSLHQIYYKPTTNLPRYEWNAAQDALRFYPCEKCWSRILHPLEYFCCTVYTGGALHFKGKLDQTRFIEALQYTLKNFDFLFCRLHTDGGQVHASYSENSNNFVQLELEHNGSSSPLPEKIDDRIRTGMVDDLEGLPMCALKVTTLHDGFTLGYRFNHALLDQASIFYFFKYLSIYYSDKTETEYLAKPKLADFDLLTAKNTPTFRDLEEFRAYGKSQGFQFLADKSELTTKITTPFPGAIVDVHFKLSALSKLKAESECFITENDLINALLLKIYAMDPSFLPNEEQHFSFPCNMRKKCGLDESVIGNLVYSCRLTLKTDYIRKATLIELAQINRKALNAVTPEAFKEWLMWYEGFTKFSQNPKEYVLTNFIKPQHWTSSNWSSFNYQEIAFDHQQATTLTTPSASSLLASLGMSVICFDTPRNEKTPNAVLGIPTASLKAIKEYGRLTGLYETTETHNN